MGSSSLPRLPWYNATIADIACQKRIWRYIVRHAIYTEWSRIKDGEEEKLAIVIIFVMGMRMAVFLENTAWYFLHGNHH